MSVSMGPNVLDTRDQVFSTFFKSTAPRCPAHLLNNVSKLRAGVERLVIVAPKFDFNEKVQANGYWTFAKIMVKFVQRVNEGTRRGPSGQCEPVAASLLELSTYLVTQLTFVERIHHSNQLKLESRQIAEEKSEKLRGRLVINKDTLQVDSSPISAIDELEESKEESDELEDIVVDESGLFNFDETIVSAFLDKQRDPATARQLGALYGHHNSFYLSECLRKLVSRFCLMSVIYSSPLTGIISSLRSRDYRGAAHASYALNTNLDTVKRLWSTTEGVVFKRLLPSLLYPLTPKVARTLYVQRPSTGAWLVHPFTGSLVRDRAGLVYERENRVRCRLLQNPVTPGGQGGQGQGPEDSLVLHCHGAAFVAQSPDSHEIYLRDWARRLDGVPILSVDYSLAPERKWPAAIQDILDVYLWATSGRKSVVDQLGFRPKRIVLTGDSAGAVLALNLLHILSDIREEDSEVRLPAAVVAAYPVALVQIVMSPSRMLVTMDSLLPTGCLLSALEAYLFNIEDLIYKCPEMSYPEVRSLEGRPRGGLVSYVWHAAKSAMLGEEVTSSGYTNSGGAAWYRRSPKTVARKLDEINRKGSHPYASPLHSGNYDQFPEVGLYLAVGEYDVFLDDSVALAKKWRGPVTLDVLPEICHGFLYFGLMSDRCREANDLVVRRLRQALNLS